ncbi:MAG: hypothetical protein K2P81_02985 [Bacteriovoracaceae bacterium]|nr:hypothetical protein [Bacteriovoracaceae bacterium]
MRFYWILLLTILVGCNVANQPATLSQGGGVNSGSSTPKITFTNAAINRSEASPMASLPFTFSQTTTGATDVSFTFSGTAVGGTACTGSEDYITPSTINLTAGVTSSVLDIVLCNDSVYEGNETIIATISSVIPTHGLGSIATAVVTITDSLPVPQVSFTSASSGSVPEGAAGFTTIPVSVQLSHASTLPVTIQFMSSGTAAIGTDYGLSATSLTFAPGTTLATLFVSIYGDNIIEPNENISLGLFAPFHASLGVQTTHDIQIATDEVPGTLQATVVASGAVAEAASTQNIVVTLTGALDHAAILNYTIDFSSAIAATQRASFPSDFTLPGNTSSSGYIMVPAGATSVNIPIGIVDDGVYEPSEGIVLRILGGPEISPVSGFDSTEMIISSNDVANKPLVSFQIASQSILEANPSASVVVRLLDPTSTAERASGEDVVVTLGTIAQTTEGAADWSMALASITIPAGQTRVTVPVSIVQDGVDEDDEYFDITLTPPAGYTAGANTTHRITILDSDPASRASFQLSSSTMAEAAGSAAISVNVILDKPSERTLTVNYTVTGSSSSSTAACGGSLDVSAPGTLTITPGLTTVALSAATLCADTVYEGSETAIFTMTSVTNGLIGSPSVHTMTITDDEVAPSIDISTSNASPTENGGGITLTATITNGVTAQTALIIPVTFTGTAVSGTHYTAGATSIVIAAGGTSGTMSVGITNNSLYGGDKTLNATLGAGIWSLGTSSVAMTILEDETLPEVGFTSSSVTVAETVGAQSATLRVNPGFASCESPISFAISRTGTATYGADHDFLHPTAGIAAAATSTNLAYNILDDMIYEPGGAETIILTITSATCNGVALTLNPSVQTISITDDDPIPTLGYSVTSQNVSENTTSVTLTISMDRPSSQAVNFNSDLVPYTPAPGSTTNKNDPEYYKALIPGDASLATSALIIPAGSTSVSQTLTVVNDGVYEYPESASLQITGVTGASLSGTHNAMTVTILDNDAAPYAHLTFVNDPTAMTNSVSAVENVGASTTIYALLSNTPGNGGTAYTSAVPVEIPVTLGGTAAAVTGSTYTQDYTLTVLGTSGGTLIVPAGQSFTSYTISPVDDTIYENAETAIFTTGTIVNGQTSGSFPSVTYNITLDVDSPPTTTISSTYTAPIEEANVTASYVITVQPVGRQVVISYSVAGTATATVDHNLSAGTITVNPSSSPQTFPLLFQILDDSVAEPLETIITTISGADINATVPSATINIDVSDPLVIRAGNGFSCGLLDGNVKCWGQGNLLGRGSTVNYGGVGQPVSGLANIDLGTGWVTQKIDVGAQHACALSTAGQVKCWGYNAYGQLGLDKPGIGVDQYIGDAAGEMGNSLNAVALGEAAIDISTGYYHSCAVTSSGRVKCWGYNAWGQVGQPKAGLAACSSTTSTYCYGDQTGEVAGMSFISSPNGTFTSITAGGFHTCATTDTNKIYCWGYNPQGELGRNDSVFSYGSAVGDMTNVSTFLPVGFHSNFASAQIINIFATDYNTCAVLNAGVVEEIVCWGYRLYGLAGQGNNSRDYGGATYPLTGVTASVDLTGFGSANFTRLKAYGKSESICVRGENSEAFCWGNGASLRLGTNSTSVVGDVSVVNTLGDDPDGALITGTWTDVTSGYTHSCGVISYNQYKCWGANTSSALGVQSNNATEGDVTTISAQTF